MVLGLLCRQLGLEAVQPGIKPRPRAHAGPNDAGPNDAGSNDAGTDDAEPNTGADDPGTHDSSSIASAHAVAHNTGPCTDTDRSSDAKLPMQ